MSEALFEMTLAALIWVVTHLGLASSSLRPRLVSLIGQSGFLVLYSIVAFGALGYLIWVYVDVPHFEYAWLPNPDLYWPAKLLLPFALILAVGGFMVRNPTQVGVSQQDMEALVAQDDVARGGTRITRHPFQWGVILWGATHMLANGDWVSLIFFGSFVVVSLLGTLLMDIKKRRQFGDAWLPYAEATSNIPFAAIISSRNRLAPAEQLWPVIAGLVTYVLLYYFHEAITGTIVL